MKKTIGMLAVVMAIFVMFFVTPVLAWDPPSTEVDGAIRIEGFKTFGDEVVGSWSYINSGAGFRITDYGCRRSAAEGEAEANGFLKAGGEVKDNSLRLNSLSRTNSDAAQLRGDHGEIYVDGLTQRANWGLLKKGDNFISGWDFSEAQYNGLFTGPSPSAIGKAITKGDMELKLTPTSSEGKITDESKASIRGTPGAMDPSVKGDAGLASGNYVSGPDYAVKAETDAGATYTATDSRRATGSLEITSSTNVTQTPGGGISLKAKTTSKAEAKTGPPSSR